MHPYDLTCRPHIISKYQNKEYEELINKFGEISGTYALLNTSFNLAGDTIVETVDDALNTLRNSEIDYIYFPETSTLI